MKLKHIACALALGAGLAAQAPAAVLSFDDITADGLMADIAGGRYGGLDWSAGDWSAYVEPQDPYNPSSGAVRLVSGFEDPDAATAIRFLTATTFQGAYFSGLEGATVTYELFYQGRQVGGQATLDPDATPRFLASGYAGLVDEVIVSSPGQGSYAMDDFTFGEAAPVPEPAAWASMALGMGLLAAGRRLARRITRR